MLLEDKRDSLALVDKFESWMDGTCIVVDQDDNITDFIPGKLLQYREKEQYYKTVNIYKFGADFRKCICTVSGNVCQSYGKQRIL